VSQIRSRRLGSQLAVADIEPTGVRPSRKALLSLLDDGPIQGVVRPIPRNDEGDERDPEGIQGRHHDLELAQVRAMVFAEAVSKQSLFGHRSVAARGRPIDSDRRPRSVSPFRRPFRRPFRIQVIDANQAAVQDPLERGPIVVVAQIPQESRQSVIGEIQPFQAGIDERSQRLQAGFDPGADMVEAVVGFRQQVGQPDLGDLTQAQPLPVAMDGKDFIHQFYYSHSGDLPQKNGKVIDTFGGDLQDFHCS
jgi:hypothetical protein